MAIWGEFIFQFLRFEKFDYNSDNERIIGNLIAKEPSLCNQNWIIALTMSGLLAILIAKEPSLCNQNWIMYGSFVRTPGRPQWSTASGFLAYFLCLNRRGVRQ